VSRSRWRSLLLACAAALALLLGPALTPPAQAELIHDRQLPLRASTGGLFLHWGMKTSPGYTDCAAWEKAVTDGGWNPNYWVQEGLKLHVQYLVLASFHSRLGYARSWPSAIPGSCSTKRDFLGELIAAAKPKGLNVILYMTDDPQWYWEGWQPTKPPNPADPADQAKQSWLDSAAYSAYKHKDVNLHLRPGFGEFSYDSFVEVMHNYPNLSGFWIDNDNEYWEQNGLYERIHAERPSWTLSNNNEDTPIMDMVSHEQKVGMTPAYDYPQAVWTPAPRLTEGEWKLPVKGAWWYDGSDSDVDYPVTLGRIVTNAGSSIKSLMAETAMVNGRFPPKQEAFNNLADGYLAAIWESIHGVEGAGYLYGGLVPGFWNDGAHGVVTISRTDPNIQYVHVLTRPATAGAVVLRDNGYRVARVRDLRTGRPMPFRQADGTLTIDGVTSWDTYDTVFKVETAGQVGDYPQGTATATATASADGFPAANLVDGDYLTYWDSKATLPVAVTLDLGHPRRVGYLAVNQREWSPTYNRSSFGRPEDSARIKDYTVEVSTDGNTWSAARTGVMPSARGVQFADLTAAEEARYVRLTVTSTWSTPDAPRYYQQLRIDELRVGDGHATATSPGQTRSYEAEHGWLGGTARVAACPGCAGGRKVQGVGGGQGDQVTIPVWSWTGCERLLTVVGAAAGTGTAAVSVNGRPVGAVSVTGWSTSAPLVGRTVPVRLRPGVNLIRLGNDTGTAPDLDRIVLGPR
jgi:alpha-L-fucosidase